MSLGGIVLLVLLLLSQLLFAEPVPLYNTGLEASDLLHPKTQEPLSSEQVLKLNTDSSKLEPEKTTYYDGVKKNLDLKNQTIENLDLSDLTLSEVPSYQALGLIQIIVKDQKGKKYYIYFGPKSHNIVLRNGLLAKLGYVTQPIKHQLNLELKTSSVKARSLLQFLQSKLIFKNSNRWIKNVEKELINDQWVWKYTNSSTDKIQLQDVIIAPVNNKTFDLDYGYVAPQIIDGFRSLNALLVPYSLVEVPESINKFLPQPGQIYDQKLYLDYSLQNSDYDTFTTTFNDAKWISRKLSKLTREDFQDIVSQVNYPTSEISQLLVEKLIARRNWLTQTLLPNEHIPLINNNLNFSKGLVKNGVITKQTSYTNPKDVLDPDKWYVGYGSRFSFEQKEAPISWEQIQSYMWTLLSTNLQANVIQQINDELPQTDLEKKSTQNNIDFQIDSFFNCVLTDDCDPDTDYWNTPFFKFKLLNQRAVQFGSVFGTNNQIQLVEEFGVGLDAGVFFSALGLDPTELLTAQVDAGYLRKWTHIKPLASIKETLKSEYYFKILPKFKSLLVPYNQYKLGHSLKDLTTGAVDRLSSEMKMNQGEFSRSEKQQAVDSLLSQFLESFAVGQSYIITDQISFGAGINFGKKLSNNWQLNASTSSKVLDLARMHLYRATETDIHIYISKAVLSETSLGINLNLYIPVISSYWGYKNSADLGDCLTPQTEEINIIKQSEYTTSKSSSCSPTTYFYKMDIQSVQAYLEETLKNTNDQDLIKSSTHAHTQQLIQNLKILSEGLTRYSIAKTQKTLEKLKLPQKVQHNFTESTKRLSLLSKQWFKAKTSDLIDIETVTPAQELSATTFSEDDLLVQRKTILHHKKATRTGNNYQKLLTDIANWYIDDKIENSDVNVNIPSNGNPGDTIYGQATQRKLTLEAVVEEDFVVDPIVKIQLNHKVWKLNFQQTMELVDELNQKFGSNFINPDLFYGMDEYQLYQVQVEHIVFNQGLMYLIQNKPEHFRHLFNQANVRLYASEKKKAHDEFLNLEEALEDKKYRAYVQFKRKSKKLFRAYEAQDLDEFKDLSLDMIDYLDSLFDYKELNQFFGEGSNHENSYVYANLSGFKKGIENALEDIKSIHLGEVGQYPLGGPADYYRKEHLQNMSPGEFYLTWILEAY